LEAAAEAGAAASAAADADEADTGEEDDTEKDGEMDRGEKGGLRRHYGLFSSFSKDGLVEGMDIGGEGGVFLFPFLGEEFHALGGSGGAQGAEALVVDIFFSRLSRVFFMMMHDSFCFLIKERNKKKYDDYSTVTVLARFRGKSGLIPRVRERRVARSWRAMLASKPDQG
jgi:hypothetical protein